MALLDASAVLAVINEEPGGEIVTEALSGAAISAVNYAEVISKLTDYGLTGDEVREAADSLDIPVIPFDAEAALVSGLMRAATRHKGLSLGDRACLAQGRISGEPVLTADRAWNGLDLGVEIRLIR